MMADIKYGSSGADFARAVGTEIRHQFEQVNPDRPLEVLTYYAETGDDRDGLVYVEALRMTLVDEKTGRDVPTYNTDDKQPQFVIGYDIETVDAPAPRILSHQLYFSNGRRRLGIVLITPTRFSEAEFIELLEHAIPVGVRKAYIVAHFSIYEGTWLKPSLESVKLKTGKEYKRCRIPYRGKQWNGIRSIPRPPAPPAIAPAGRAVRGRKPAKPKERSTVLCFADSSNFVKSLRGVGAAIGIDKLDHHFIDRMGVFLEKHPKEFVAYGITDSVITAEALLYYWQLFCKIDSGFAKGGPRLSVPSYAEAVFRKIFETIYGDPTYGFVHWQHALGIYSVTGHVRVLPAADEFLKFYYGGRNEVFEVGARGGCTYYDLTSAYPVAVMMLDRDYRFDAPVVHTGEAAKDRVKSLRLSSNPFQIVGVMLSWRFKGDKQPLFPVRMENGSLVFPRAGRGYVMWPELFVAFDGDLLEFFEIEKVVEFLPVSNGPSALSDAVADMLIQRAVPENKMLFKLLLNSFIGKTTQSVTPKLKGEFFKRGANVINPSSISCYPIAAYALSVCRAIMGELLNRNECYAITTDGFISPVRELKKGPVLKAVAERVAPTGHVAINADFVGVKSLFLKTRGYILVDESGRAKTAKMGVRVERGAESRDSADDDSANSGDILIDVVSIDSKILAASEIKPFLHILSRGWFNKASWPSFATIRDKQLEWLQPSRRWLPKKPKLKSLPVPETQVSHTRVSTTFDFKRIPIPDSLTMSVFEHDGVTLSVVDFNSTPLRTADDFDTIRRFARRNASLFDYENVLADAADHGICERFNRKRHFCLRRIAKLPTDREWRFSEPPKGAKLANREAAAHWFAYFLFKGWYMRAAIFVAYGFPLRLFVGDIWAACEGRRDVCALKFLERMLLLLVMKPPEYPLDILMLPPGNIEFIFD